MLERSGKTISLAASPKSEHFYSLSWCLNIVALLIMTMNGNLKVKTRSSTNRYWYRYQAEFEQMKRQQFFASTFKQNNESTEEILCNRKQEVLRAISEAYSEDQILIKANPKKGHKGPRSSRFRGVSLNGKKWQTLVMGFKKKAYRGRHNTELEAAIDYDKNSVLSQGLNVSLAVIGLMNF